MDPVSPPQVTSTPGFHSVAWAYPSSTVVFEADRIQSHSDGRLQARVRIVSRNGAGKERTLHQVQLNLAAGQSRSGMAKDLATRFESEEVNWRAVIEESCLIVLEREDEGRPAEYLERAENLQVDYILRPLIPEHLPVLMYAPGGSGKSFLDLYLALVVQNGLTFLGEPTRRRNVLILDWEATKSEADRRCTLLANGLEQTAIGSRLEFPLYRRCIGAIHNEASEIARTIAKHEIGLVMVDSAGPACGGDISSAEIGIRFYETLRKVTASTEAATWTSGHTTKADRREENAPRLPIGSIYFENLARLTWEVRPQETSDERILQVGMFLRKSNIGRAAPIGLKFTFQRNAITVDSTAANDVLTEHGATRSVILSELARGPVSISDLAEATGATSGAVRQHLLALKQRGEVEPVSRGVYRLVEG